MDEIGEKQLSVFGSRGGHICPLMHVPLYCINTIKQPSLCLEYRKPDKLYNWTRKRGLKVRKLFRVSRTEKILK